MLSKAMLVGLIVGAFVLVTGSNAELHKIGEFLEEFKQKFKAPGEHFRNKLAGYNGNFDVNFKIGNPATGFRSPVGGAGQQIQGYGNYYPPQNVGYGNYYPPQNQGYGNVYPPQNQMYPYSSQNQGYGNYYPQQNQGYGNFYPAQQGAGYNVPANGLSLGYGANIGYNSGYQPGYFDLSTQAGYNVPLGVAQQQGNGYIPANNVPQGYGSFGYNPGYQPGYVDPSTQTTYNVPLGVSQQPGLGSNALGTNAQTGTGGSSSGSLSADAQQQGNGYVPANNVYGNIGYNPGSQPGYVDSSTQTTYNVPLGVAQQPGGGLTAPATNGLTGTGGGSSSGLSGSLSVQLDNTNKPVSNGNTPVTGITG